MLSRVQHEAGSIFGNKAVVLERFLPNARHIEVQIFGDCFDNIVHLYERDCSVQRKYQKIVEELLSKGDPSQLFGKDGLFNQLKKQIVERVLEPV